MSGPRAISTSGLWPGAGGALPLRPAPIPPGLPLSTAAHAGARAPLRRALTALACGVVLGTCCVEPGAWPLALVALMLAAGAQREHGGRGPSPQMLTWAGLLAAGQWWVWLAPAVSGPGSDLWRALAVLVTVGTGLLAMAVSRGLIRWATAGRWPALQWLLAWAAVEPLRQTGWAGNGGAGLGLPFLDAPGAAGWIPLLGLAGWGVLVAALAWAGAGALQVGMGLAPDARRRTAVLAAALLLVLAGEPLARIDWTRPTGRSLPVTLLQLDRDKHAPWSAAQRDEGERRLLAALGTATPGTAVITPENFFGEPRPTEPDDFWLALQDITAARGVHALIGLPGLLPTPEGPRVMNTLLQIAPGRESVYAKERLVPVAESLPFEAWLPAAWQGLFGPGLHGQQPGPEPLHAPLFIDGHLLGASICHEQAFARTLADRARGSQALLNVSEDGWIPSAMFRAQMQGLARARALEAGLPLLRVSNGGRSLLIDAQGRLERQAPAHGDLRLDWDLAPRDGQTPHTRLAGVWAALPWALIGALGLWRLWRAPPPVPRSARAAAATNPSPAAR